MKTESQQILTAALAAAGPLGLLLFGLLPGNFLNRHGLRAARLGAGVALGALGCGVLAAASLVWSGKADVKFSVAGPFQLGVYFDNLSAIVLTLVAFLLAVVTRFSINYLAGDPAQGRFAKWLALTGGSVLTIVISGNLVQFALAWCATSLCLHQLLLFYPGRPGAILAARKKFMISRLGDACLLTVIVLVFHELGTWDFPALFNAARELHAN